MSDLDARIRDWRGRQERETSLSPRELDELEDHLRARTKLELELNAALTSQRAVELAREVLGGEHAMSRQFAKAGKPRWRKLLVAGWALFGASFLLPVFYVPEAGLSLARPFGIEPYYGYEVFWELYGGRRRSRQRAGSPESLRGDDSDPHPAPRKTLLTAALAAVCAFGRRYRRLGARLLGAAGRGCCSQAGAPPAFAQHLGISFWARSL